MILIFKFYNKFVVVFTISMTIIWGRMWFGNVQFLQAEKIHASIHEILFLMMNNLFSTSKQNGEISAGKCELILT